MSDRTDTERLDWLGKQHNIEIDVGFDHKRNWWTWNVCTGTRRTRPQKSLRIAIDKAIDGGEFE